MVIILNSLSQVIELTKKGVSRAKDRASTEWLALVRTLEQRPPKEQDALLFNRLLNPTTIPSFSPAMIADMGEFLHLLFTSPPEGFGLDISSYATELASRSDAVDIRLSASEVIHRLETLCGVYCGQPAVPAPVSQAPVGQAPLGQALVGQAPLGQAPLGQALVGHGQAPLGQAPLGQALVGQAPLGQAPLGQGPSGQVPSHQASTTHVLVGLAP